MVRWFTVSLSLPRLVTATLIPPIKKCLKNSWNKTPTQITFIGTMKHVHEATVCDGVA
jgi:hypothetical protein